MTGFSRSKSAGAVGLPESNPTRLGPDYGEVSGDDEEEDERGSCSTDDGDESSQNQVSTPTRNDGSGQGQGQLTVLDIVTAVLRKSLLVTCSVERGDVAAMEIGWPTEVKHVSHVTFDRFNGFLGLPSELEPEVPPRAPSASVSVFGVSAKSMQCSYDSRGNSVPTILLRMQKRLYAEGGLKAEGIFRINPDNGQEEHVRSQLNRGVVPRGIDVHCLAGLIKAWFRELPTGVLDLLTPEQVMRCNTEEDCTRLVTLLPPVESALLDWAINLMADVVEHEQLNKMNARNVAMVFAPNMTQMADPLTALIHAVQVMNFLKTLIQKILREREQAEAKARSLEKPSEETKQSPCSQNRERSRSGHEKTGNPRFLRVATLCRLEADNEEEMWNLEKEKDFDSRTSDDDSSAGLRLMREGVERLCRHPVFQISKPLKKATVNTRDGGGGGRRRRSP
ncbi:PREDICTED: rho GTPase-activating protein 3 [Tarenaya hassleriana]|uniref:rho GTPase-activating protein 3 n=1 Tax=Tarenaya hassleriana TaxID=28532 RepID=UPI00053C365F|nr:PREDICTED: rho GTPase-activating protein 3 [Tarenaya hassleriana]